MDDVTTPKKGSKMAANKIELSTLPYKQLIAVMEEAQALVHSKRKEELREIAKLYIESLESAGFTKAEGIEALGVRTADDGSVKIVSRFKSGAKAGGVDIPKSYWGKTFKDATTGETWTKSSTGKGKPKNWIVEAIASGKTLDDLLVK